MNIKWGLISIASLFLVFIYQAGLSCAQHDEPPVIDGIQISNSWVSVSTMNDLTCEAYDPAAAADRPGTLGPACPRRPRGDAAGPRAAVPFPE